MFIFFLVVISLIGFSFRLFGIIDLHSLWTDESNVALYARAIHETGLPILNTGYTPGIYQIGYHYLLALFGVFGGINELTVRLPSVIFGAISVFMAGLLIWKLTNSKIAAIFTSILFSLSQVQLAYSTQARPYIIIQALSFFIFYLMIIEEKASFRNKIIYFLINIILGIFALLLHATGYLVFLAIIIYYFLSYWNQLKKKLKIQWIVLIIGLFLILGYILNIHFWFGIIFSVIINQKFVFNTAYLNQLLLREYGVIFLPSLIGFIFLFKRNWKIAVSLFVWFGSLLFLWLFIHYSHNVRYLVPLLGWMLLLFCYFWYQVSTLLPKKSWIIFLLVGTLLIGGGNKFVRKPSYYYSPNADFSSDVQMADYKTVYQLLNDKYGNNLSDYAIFDDWNDRTLWYLNRKPDGIFVKNGTYGEVYPVNDPMSGSVFYNSLDQFKEQMQKYPKGIVFVEDWVSIMPDDIKEYIRNNLKLEFRIEGLEHANGDNWPVEVYSWGI